MLAPSLRNAVLAAATVVLAGAAVLALRPSAAAPSADAEEPAPVRPAAVVLDPWKRSANPRQSAIVYDRFETLGVADGLPSEHVTSVLAEGDDLYVGTDRGLAVRRGGTWTVIDESDGLSHRYVTSVARDVASDTTWVSTLKGLSRISGGDVRVYTQKNSGLVNDVIYHCVTDGPLVWCGTGAGMSVLDTRSGSWTIYDTANAIMREPWCYAIALGPQRAWIGLWGGAIAELDRRTGRWREYRDPDGEMEIDLLKDDGPIHEVTSFVAFEDGMLWQVTYFGMARYDGRSWQSFTKADAGLPGDFMQHVATRGRAAWLGTDEGFGVMRDDTVISYVRQDDGTCLVRTVKAGVEQETRTIATAPGDNYILWTFPRERDVWIATGSGLSRGIARETTDGGDDRTDGN